jgi:hypothetical protein
MKNQVDAQEAVFVKLAEDGILEQHFNDVKTVWVGII